MQQGLFDPLPQAPTQARHVGNAGDKRGGKRRSYAWDGVEPFAALVRSMPKHKAAIENSDLILEGVGLNAERNEAGAHDAWNSIVTAITNKSDQGLHTSAPHRRNDPKLAAAAGFLGPVFTGGATQTAEGAREG